MNKDLTIVFSSYQSQNLLKQILKAINTYKVIIIENSCDSLIKKNLEEEFNNVEVVIPEFKPKLKTQGKVFPSAAAESP